DSCSVVFIPALHLPWWAFFRCEKFCGTFVAVRRRAKPDGEKAQRLREGQSGPLAPSRRLHGPPRTRRAWPDVVPLASALARKINRRVGLAKGRGPARWWASRATECRDCTHWPLRQVAE